MPTTTPPLKLLEKLCNAIAVSGDESEVRKIVMEEIKDHADDVRVDVLGSVLATKLGKGKRRVKVMLDAHMDEVGFMIVADDGEGIYRFETVGGMDARHLVGKQVYVGKERSPGVIGGKPIHLMESSEVTRKVPIDALRIDLGLAGKAKVGDRAGFATKFRRVGPSIMAKSLDNRFGVATVIELFKHAPSNIDLCAAFTVQEEIGLRGAKVAAQYFNPDLAITIDSTPANDLPDFDGNENTTYNTKLGLGPAIYIADSSTLRPLGWFAFFKRSRRLQRSRINSVSPVEAEQTPPRSNARLRRSQRCRSLCRTATLIRPSASPRGRLEAHAESCCERR
ncbi:MAG: hypothetical protein U0X93_17675 [Anaerolineales bacterium]